MREILYRRYQKQIKMQLIFNKNGRLPSNTGKLECMSGDVQQNFSTQIPHTVKKEFSTLPSVFCLFCVCNVNFEQMFLYSVTLDPQYLWSVFFRSYKTSKIRQLSLTVTKACSEIRSSTISYNTLTGQLIGFCVIRVFTERYFSVNYSAGFFKDMRIFKNRKIILIP